MVATIDNKGGSGKKLVDINPTRAIDNAYRICYTTSYSTTVYVRIPCGGYDKFSMIPKTDNRPGTYAFILDDGTTTSAVTVSANNWSSWVQIPDNAVMIQVSTMSSTDTQGQLYGAFLSKDSPYNV